MECTICFEEKNNFVFFGCAHAVCQECYIEMVRFKHNECPHCRFKLHPQVMHREPQCRTIIREEPFCPSSAVQTLCCAATCLVGIGWVTATGMHPL